MNHDQTPNRGHHLWSSHRRIVPFRIGNCSGQVTIAQDAIFRFRKCWMICWRGNDLPVMEMKETKRV